MSRYFDEICKALEATLGTGEEIVHRGRLAQYWARRGDREKSKSEIARCRGSRDFFMKTEAVANINIAEAVLLASLGRLAESTTLARRALAMLRVGAPTSLETAGILGWVAHFEHLNQVDSDAILSLEDGFSSLPESNPSYWFRLLLTVADMLAFSGELDSARDWYRRARRAAELSGDEIAVAELTYNMAAYFCHETRIREAQHAVSEAEIGNCLRFVSTAKSYSGLRCGSDSEWMLRILEMQALMLDRRYQEVVVTADRDGYQDLLFLIREELRLLLRADVQLCFSRRSKDLVNIDEITDIAELTRSEIDAGDRGLIFSSLGAAASVVPGLSALSRRFFEQASECFSLNRLEQLRISDGLKGARFFNSGADLDAILFAPQRAITL